MTREKPERSLVRRSKRRWRAAGVSMRLRARTAEMPVW
jgi:hypothetical protein